MEIVELQTDLIDEDQDQPRYQFDDEALQELARSIGELGLLSPIKVRPAAGGRYKIIYGNRRYKACRMLGRPTIPCIVSDATDETDIYLEQIAENLTREGFSPIEEAEAFQKLLSNDRFSGSVKYVAGKLGKPEAYVKNKCELLKFSPAVKRLIVRGTEIRPDALTEEQVLPLKDLPLEYRDALALIVARDAMPVSDVKKIARLFKDPGLSESTKGKLLYKTGNELLETWSVLEHNRKERARAAAAKEEAEKERLAREAQANAEPAAEAEGATETKSAAAPAPEADAAAALRSRLQQLSALLAAHPPIDPADGLSAAAGGADDIRAGLDALIGELEAQLKGWRDIRERIGRAPGGGQAD